MGETTDSYEGAEFLGFGWLLQEICGGFLQDGESINTTHQKGSTFLLDG